MRSSHHPPTPARASVAGALLLAACVAHAQGSPAAQGQQLLQAGRAAEAYQLMEGIEGANAGNVEFDLAFARAANAVGEYTRAIMALERILARDPSHREARAEMGRALAAVGDRKAARTLLEESRAQGMEMISGQSVDQMLHAIERIELDGVSTVRGYVEGSIGYDSNINSAPGVSSVAVPAFGGSILAINAGGTRQSGGFAAISAGATGRMVTSDPRWSFIGTVASRLQKFGGGNGDLDNAQIDAKGGASYRVDRNELSGAIQVGTYQIDGRRVRDVAGLVGEWTHRFNAFRQFNLYVQSGRLTYPQARIADVNRHVLGATYAQEAGQVWWYGGAYLGRERARDPAAPYLGHRLWGARGGVQFPVATNLTGLVSAGYENRDYGGTDPLFLVGRDDRQANAAVGLSWTVKPGLRVVPQWSWTRTNSSVPLSAFRKSAFSLAVRQDF